jgi:Predicted signal transduction protein with a C-terminal ATPase domain
MDKIIQFLRKFNIKNRIAFFLLLGLVVSSNCIFIGSKLIAQALIKNYLYNYVGLTQKETATSIELIIDEINMLEVRLLEDKNIYNLFDDRVISFRLREDRLKKEFDKLLVRRDVVGDIFIFSNSGEIYEYASANMHIQPPEEHYLRLIERSSLSIWGPVKKDSNNNAYIPVGRKYRNFVTGEKIGYLIIYIRESALYDIYRKIVPDWGYSFILANNEYIISHPQKDKIGSIIFDSSIFDTQKEYSYQTIRNNNKWFILAIHQISDRLKSLGVNWKIVSVISEVKLFGIITDINKFILTIEIVMSVLAVFLALYLSFNITKSLARLKGKLELISKGKLELLGSGSGDEIAILEQSFNTMVLSIQDLIRKNNLEKEKQRELELIALQAQINPHFVYNTLDAIGWIAKLRKQDDIERMVIALGTFFRISLHKGDKFITVEEEIQLIKNYIVIEQFRFPDKVEVTYDIPDDIKYCLILKIILQPLVENSIKHGISLKDGKGHIWIKGYRKEEDLVFEVIDDGMGFEMGSTSFHQAYEERQHSGYGLRNVDERIKLEYGKRYGLAIKSTKNEGTTIIVTVKAHQA